MKMYWKLILNEYLNIFKTISTCEEIKDFLGVMTISGGYLQQQISGIYLKGNWFVVDEVAAAFTVECRYNTVQYSMKLHTVL